MLSDEELYNNFKKGDADALHDLMERYGNPLALYAGGLLHDVHEGEDIMIEAFAYLIAKKPSIYSGSVKSYLYASVRHMAIRIAKKRRTVNTFGFDDLCVEPEAKELIEEKIQQDEKYRILYQCMDNLRKEFKEVLYLIYFEEMSYREIAKVLHKNEKQIDNLAYRGKKDLKDLLQKEGFDHEY